MKDQQPGECVGLGGIQAERDGAERLIGLCGKKPGVGRRFIDLLANAVDIREFLHRLALGFGVDLQVARARDFDRP